MKITVSLKCTEFTFGFAGVLYFCCCSQRLSENLRRCRLSTFWILITLTSILHLCFSFYLFHIVGSPVTLEIKDILYAITWLEPDLGKQKDGENPCCNKLRLLYLCSFHFHFLECPLFLSKAFPKPYLNISLDILLFGISITFCLLHLLGYLLFTFFVCTWTMFSIEL